MPTLHCPCLYKMDFERKYCSLKHLSMEDLDKSRFCYCSVVSFAGPTMLTINGQLCGVS